MENCPIEKHDIPGVDILRIRIILITVHGVIVGLWCLCPIYQMLSLANKTNKYRTSTHADGRLIYL